MTSSVTTLDSYFTGIIQNIMTAEKQPLTTLTQKRDDISVQKGVYSDLSGMITKLQAADLARRSGTTVVIANGREPNVLTRLVNGEKLGTRFQPVVTSIESRKRYILAGGHAHGHGQVDAGAVQALRNGGSLLPIGITQVSGTFERGDTVRVLEDSGHEVARGIANYPGRDLTQIIRRRSDEIEAILGYTYGDEVIHHNDLVLL